LSCKLIILGIPCPGIDHCGATYKHRKIKDTKRCPKGLADKLTKLDPTNYSTKTNLYLPTNIQDFLTQANKVNNVTEKNPKSETTMLKRKTAELIRSNMGNKQQLSQLAMLNQAAQQLATAKNTLDWQIKIPISTAYPMINLSTSPQVIDVDHLQPSPEKEPPTKCQKISDGQSDVAAFLESDGGMVTQLLNRAP